MLCVISFFYFCAPTLIALIDLEPENKGFSDFWAIFGCKRVNCDEMDALFNFCPFTVISR